MERNFASTLSNEPKTCKVCNVRKPRTEFRHRFRTCKDCEKEKVLEWKKNNKKKYNEYCRIHQRKAVQNLSDTYIAHIIQQRIKKLLKTHIPLKQIPKEIIQHKRAHMLLQQKLKIIQNEKAKVLIEC